MLAQAALLLARLGGAGWRGTAAAAGAAPGGGAAAGRGGGPEAAARRGAELRGPRRLGGTLAGRRAGRLVAREGRLPGPHGAHEAPV